MQQRFRSRRAAWDINIDRDVAVDSLEKVVALFEWPAGNRACTHRDYIFRMGDVGVKPDSLLVYFFVVRRSFAAVPGRHAEPLPIEEGSLGYKHRPGCSGRFP